MSKSLEERLRDAKAQLDNTDSTIRRQVGRVSKEVADRFLEVTSFAGDLGHWIGLIQARRGAREFLAGLESLVDPDDLVQFGSGRVHFQHARMIGVQGYLATNWALADRLTGVVSRILCIKDGCDDPNNPPKLASYFVGDKNKSKVAAVLFGSLRQTFGWPICLSYAIRNHLIHDGGRAAGVDLFAGVDSVSRFELSHDGWAQIQTAAKKHGVDASDHRAGHSWPASVKGRGT